MYSFAHLGYYYRKIKIYQVLALPAELRINVQIEKHKLCEMYRIIPVVFYE